MVQLVPASYPCVSTYPPLLATCVPIQVDIADGKATVERETDNGTQVIEMNLPCVITADLRLNEPR